MRRVHGQPRLACTSSRARDRAATGRLRDDQRHLRLLDLLGLERGHVYNGDNIELLLPGYDDPTWN